MIQNLNSLISDNAKVMKRSVIRDLLKVATRPEIISFAGGFPNPRTFPVEELKEIMMEVLNEMPFQALQYGETLGVRSLREALAQRYRDQGMDVTYENFIITTASQQAIDMICTLFLNPGDTVVCGLPSYLGFLQAVQAHQGVAVGITQDEQLDVILNSLERTGKRPKFVYAIPDFQNPTGITMDLAQRKQVLEVCKQHDMLLIEDSPYREIRFEGEHLPMLYSLDQDQRVITLGTFSKTFVPAFRLGWIMAPVEIIHKLEVVKQSMDLSAPIFDQYVAAKYLQKGYLDKNLENTKALYHRLKDNIIAAFEKYMPEGVTWTNPDGGLFLFVRLPEQYDCRELFDIAIKEDVAFVIGEAFYCDGKGKNTMRINYSYMPEERATEGVRRLAMAIKTLMAAK